MNQLIKKILEIWFLINRKIRYLLVGGYNTVVGYLIFYLFNHFFADHLHYLVILTISHFISVINSFLSLRFFVFCSQKNILKEYLKINVVYLGYLVCNAALLYTLKDLLHINLMISQLICTVVITSAAYFVHKNFSFKN